MVVVVVAGGGTGMQCGRFGGLVLVVVVEVVVELVGANQAKQKEGAMGEVGLGPCTIGIVRQLCKGLGYCMGVDSW